MSSYKTIPKKKIICLIFVMNILKLKDEYRALQALFLRKEHFICHQEDKVSCLIKLIRRFSLMPTVKDFTLSSLVDL